MLYNARLEILDSWRTHTSYHGSSCSLWLQWLIYEIMPDFIFVFSSKKCCPLSGTFAASSGKGPHLLPSSNWICLPLMQYWQSRDPIALSYFWFLCSVVCHSLYMLAPSGLTRLLHPQKRLQIIMMTKPREFLLYFASDCFVLHDGASCVSPGSPGNHLLASCHHIHIKQGHLEAHLGWELLPFTVPAGLPCLEVRLLYDGFMTITVRAAI